VKLPDAPWFTFPVSKLFPSSAVTVWGALSLFVTDTEAPALTVRGVGENLKLLIVIALAADALGGGWDDADVEVVDALLEPLEPPHAPSNIATPTATTSELRV
jgi:hypothetical protein